MKINEIAKLLSNKINQEHYIMHYLEKVQRGAYNKGVKDTESKQFSLHAVVTSLPTKEEMHTELRQRVKDIKETSSMGANKQMVLAYRIGFEECDDYMRKR